MVDASDERMRKLERELRGGDEYARVMLTFLRIRQRSGFVVTWEGATEGAPVFWVFTPTTLSTARDGLRRRKRHGLAVLDLDDFASVVRRVKVGGRTPGSSFTLVDLATMSQITSCYPTVTEVSSISLTPPTAARARKVGACG